MIWHLDYNYDKKNLEQYFYDNFTRGSWYPADKDSTHQLLMWHLFNIDEVSLPIIKDLNLEGLNIKPRYRWMPPHRGLKDHVDIDNAVGININCLDDPISLRVNGSEYPYQCALINTSGYHGVTPVNHDRLILKLFIREPINNVLIRLNDSISSIDTI